MRLIDADALKEKFKEHYDLFVSAYKNEQDMSVADKSRVDEILNGMAEVINAPTVCDIEQQLSDRMKAERMSQAEFEQYAKEHGYIICTTNIIEQIRAEIQKVLDAERDFTSENVRAQAIALSWCLEIIDKYTKGAEHD